jgi:hypothetical protein
MLLPGRPQRRIAMKTHQIIVLDRSGSMSACREETISGFN